MTATETIVQKLNTQRTLLVDVVHQIEAAIKTFGGTITANGNGTAPTNGKAKSWWASLSPARRARITRKRLATRHANRHPSETVGL